MSSIPEFAELLADTRQSAAHLEMRDAYFTNPRFEAWQDGQRVDWDDRGSWWRPYHQNIADAVARGVHVRRVRIVSEPVTDYIAWEHYQTRANVEGRRGGALAPPAPRVGPARPGHRPVDLRRAADTHPPLLRRRRMGQQGTLRRAQHGLPARDRIRTDLGTGHPHDQYEVK